MFLLPAVKALNNDRIVLKKSDPKRIPFMVFRIILQGRVESGMEGHKIYGVGSGKMISSNYPLVKGGAGIDREEDGHG